MFHGTLAENGSSNGSQLLIIFCFIADVKPSNMLVNTRGGVKLCDFGVSIQVSMADHLRGG